MSTKAIALALVVIAASLPLMGSDAADSTRGFSPDGVFQFNGLDHVNLFNGNLLVDIPMASTFPLNGGFSYSIHVVYTGRAWDFQTQPGVDQRKKPIPNRRSNAGVGWRVSIGRIISPSDPTNPFCDNGCVSPLHWVYESPDGADHVFYDTIHPNDPVADTWFYTRDNSYLRLHKNSDTDVDVYFPNGETQKFVNGLLWKISTPFEANVVTVNSFDNNAGNQCNDTAATSCWKIQENVFSRTQYVTFTGTPYQRLNKIIVAAFAGSSATYSFAYQNVNLQHDDPTLCYPMWGQTPASFNVWLLTNILLPDGSQYVIDTYKDIPDADCDQGSLKTLTLPTLGKLLYKYQNNGMQLQGNEDPHPNVAVKERHQLDRNGNDLGTWVYKYSIDDQSPFCQSPCESSNEFREWRVTVRPPARTVAGASRYDHLVNYFSVARHSNYPDNPAWSASEYALPLTHNPARPASILGDGVSRFLSSEIWDCPLDQDNESGCSIKKRTYVQYQRDGNSSVSARAGDDDRREQSSLTVWLPDTDNIYALSKNSDFDGLGHYRVTENNGNYADVNLQVKTAYNSRTLATNFNNLDPDVSSTGPYTGTYPDSFLMWPTTSPWIINTYTSQTATGWTADNPPQAQTQKTLFCFDASTGFLKLRRTIRGGNPDFSNPNNFWTGTAPQTTDLVQRFTSGTGSQAGNVVSEEFFGGDAMPIGTSQLCNLNPASPTYTLIHTYAFGVRASSTHQGMSYFDLDTTVDQNTGLASSSRDTAGVETQYAYDVYRRLTQIKPVPTCNGGSLCPSLTSYTYTSASGSAPAQVEIARTSAVAGQIKQQFQYDDIGRLIREKKLMPDGSWSTRETAYTKNGWKDKVSTWASTPTYYTVFTNYDSFGRVGMITAPDGKQSTFFYQADRQFDRSVSVQTLSGEFMSTTREIYDRFNRLSQVIEPGPTGSPVPPNNNSTTTYEYDVGNRLAKSTMAAAGISQYRFFRYDNRGLLVTEAHPEVGMNGNGTITYTYDARGHVGAKRLASSSPYDLNFYYDAGEHLTRVDSYNPYGSPAFRVSKEFMFGPQNVGANLVRGKLTQSVRRNYNPYAGEIRATEDLQYADAPGRLTVKTTTISKYPDPPMQIFKQTFTYNDLDELTTQRYPTCEVYPGCGARTTDTVTQQFTNGLLTGVVGFTERPSLSTPLTIEYAPNGAVRVVHHAGPPAGGAGITDTYDPDLTGMDRLRSIKFELFTTGRTPKIVPPSGPGAGTLQDRYFSVYGAANFDPSATYIIRFTASTNPPPPADATNLQLASITQINGTRPVLQAGLLYDVTVFETLGQQQYSWSLSKGFFADFLDVPGDPVFHDSIEKLFRNGITAGCAAGYYCPNDPVRRDQMAIFLLRSKYGGQYSPPAPIGIFADVPVNTYAAGFVEELYSEGITSGCATNPLRYCPTDSITRGQMAVYVLRAKYGSGYLPPPPTGTVFPDDIHIDTPLASFIEEVAREGIATGCDATHFCPNDATTRGVMALFLRHAFDLQ